MAVSGLETDRVISPPSVVEYEEIGSISPPDVVASFPPDVAAKQYQNEVEVSSVLHEAELSMESGIKPELSRKGSSGCYFVKNRDSVSMVTI